MRLTPDEEYDMMQANYAEAMVNRQDAIKRGLPEWLLAMPAEPELRLPRSDWHIQTPFAARNWKR